MTITGKGMVFSVDFMLAFFLMLAMSVLFMVNYKIAVTQEADNVDSLVLEKEALTKLDNALKKEAAHFNQDKHRLEDNVLDLSRLEALEEKGIFLAWQAPIAASDNCLVLQRLALLDNNAVLVGVMVCEQ